MESVARKSLFNDIHDSDAQATFDYVAKALSGRGLGSHRLPHLIGMGFGLLDTGPKL